MGAPITVLTSNRLEQLLDALAERLAAAPLPPLQTETIVVPGQGMARWVTLELARRHGVAATLDLPFPGAFLQALCARTEVPARDPAPGIDRAFARPALCLRLFRLLGDHRLRSELGAAAASCADDRDQHKRLQLAQRLAACFDDYQLYRDRELLQWERGEAVDQPHARWQGRLWQELLREVGARRGPEPDPASGQGLLFAPTAAAPVEGAHRLDHLRTLLADADTARHVLPPRVFVFGLATLPPAFLDLLQRIARHVEVSIYAPKATAHFFGDLQRDRKATPRRAGQGHPLLAAWGRQSREFFDLLLDGSATGDAEQPLEFADPGTDTMLHTLQHDLLHLHVRAPHGDVPPLPLLPGDESLRVHSAHGPLREMEILRDQILHALQQDPSLSPSDVMVLVPDVQEYAPYVHAVFRPVAKLLPFHVADRSPATDLPLPATFLRLGALARGRFTAPEVLLLLEEPSLARRFGIARPDLLVLRAWVQRTRIRWGLDGQQRHADLGLPADDSNTWRLGLDRLCLGVATGEVDAPVLGLLPAGDGSASRIELLGRFVAFVDAIGDACRALSRPHTLATWAGIVEQQAASLFRPVADDERQGLLHLQAAARTLRELQDDAAVREELSPTAFLGWLEDELARQGESRGFLTGAITFAALRPMRAVPMRMLCIAGLGDGAFPRKDQRAVFDLLQHERRRGDRNARDDDRQLFLDAVLAARDRLVLSWIGRSQKDNSLCAPSPLLSELLEHLDLAFVPPAGHDRVRAAVVVEHPLQAFSPRYGGSDPRLFTYGRSAPGATATAAAATPRLRTVAHDPDGREVIELADLLVFWRHPAKWFCQRVLDIRFPGDDDRDDDAEPFTLHSLDRYMLVDDAVRARLSGRADLLASGAVQQTGMLPPGPLGAIARAEVAAATRRFFAVVERERGTGRATVVVTGDDYVVRAELDGLRQDRMVLWRPAGIRDKDRLRAFAQHAVLCAAAEQGHDLPGETMLLGTDGAITAPSCAPALHHIDALVAGFRRGRERALPYFDSASPAFVHNVDNKGEHAAMQAAHKAFAPAGYDEKPHGHDLPDPFLEFCFRDQDPIALPEFAELARDIFGRALSFFGDKDGNS